MEKKSKSEKNHKKVALVFPEDGSCLYEEDLEKGKTVVFPKIEVKIPVKDGKIRF